MREREEISRARRSGAPLVCLLLDLDDFKAVNDELDHELVETRGGDPDGLAGEAIPFASPVIPVRAAGG